MRVSSKLICSTHPTLHFAHPTLESFIWNTIIRAHAQATVPTHPPLSIYLRMRYQGDKPDFHTFTFLLQSVNSPPHIESGKQIHLQILLFGLMNDPFVQTSLINMYSSCGNLTFARQAFDEFLVGDNSHPESREIYLMLDEIMKRLKTEGYVEDTREVLLDLDDEGKELALSLHSEKLAVAFCFLKSSPGAPIRIVKNLRICRDCHVTMKMISRVFDREIVIRDCKRFHHFKGGQCSCKDYW